MVVVVVVMKVTMSVEVVEEEQGEGAWSAADKGGECEPGSYKHAMRLGE